MNSLALIFPMLLLINTVQALAQLQLTWNPDPQAVSYDVQATLNLYPANWVSITNTTETNYLFWPTQSQQFFRVLAVDTNGLNSLGYYEP